MDRFVNLKIFITCFLLLVITLSIIHRLKNIRFVRSKQHLPHCPRKRTIYGGRVLVNLTVPGNMSELENVLSITNGGPVQRGGWWSPVSCEPRKKVAVIIPFRNREIQLKVFLRHMHTFLQKQNIYYRIFIIEQLRDDPFNRAGLFNVGFVESLKFHDFNCFIFSDVDLLPEDNRNSYGCPTSPRHMSAAVDKFNYTLPYGTIFGGVGAFDREHFERVNGFSNSYWGWGGEDDDLYERINAAGLKLTRPPLIIGRYTMVKADHFQSSEPDPNRVLLLGNATKRITSDGLNTLAYKLISINEQPLVTVLKTELRRSMYP